MKHIRIVQDLEAASRAAAERVVTLAGEAVRERGSFSVALGGGHTPRRLYELLATEHAGSVDWSRTRVFWGDERCVPPDHPESNYRMAREALLDHVPVPADRIHRVRGEAPPDAAAEEYAALLAEHLGVERPGVGDRLDLVLLGMGTDGHTASLFPGGAGLDAAVWAVAARAPEGVEPRDRVTLTLAALNASRHALFLVAGSAKADAVELALNGGPEDRPPAGRVEARKGTDWLLDRAAGGRQAADW